jgi:hypothetical protein
VVVVVLELELEPVAAGVAFEHAERARQAAAATTRPRIRGRVTPRA